MNRKFGIKAWSTNLNWIDIIADNYDKGYFAFLEFFAVPHTFNETHQKWEKIKHIPIVIHGVHSGFKVNWADKEKEAFNRDEAHDGFLFADYFNSDTLIFHPGYEGNVDETIRQLGSYHDNRIVVENKCHICKEGKLIFRGSTPEELKQICDATGYDCCVDFAHAFCAANAKGFNGYEYIERFLNEINYRICHISDNYLDSIKDIHLGIGKGEYDFKRMLEMVKKDVYLTLETPKNTFQDYVNDVKILRSLVNN
ncbi:MAG: endonuclease IV [Alphaproteobacteria bacterium ADurb.Bin438]|nr:MAG: endonuclease IV [Alphaproteobacteria bacterium ADurb.Bin438]